MAEQTEIPASAARARTGLLALVVLLHIAGVVVNLNAVISGRSPNLMESVVAAAYAASWFAFAVVAGWTSGSRMVRTLAILWAAVLAIFGLALAVRDVELLPQGLRSAFIPVLAVLATPLYGASGALRVVDPLVALLICTAVLGLSCCVVAWLAARAAQRRASSTQVAA
ncbi:hypothetical protein ATK74_0663 [Propionicimonas paludicola]|uniref:Uncharacterized protein n=1 Tax=Propionicimonas paludicola TaxID=185243 RepID=A0A2A9CPK4_9ACTN|nr:hypothetical protein [Propionicimonas paludicola]PFG16131.1 hypothetical protein ATK74_0663 [Propionicimonas paludicola]